MIEHHVVAINPALISRYDFLNEYFVIVGLFKKLQANVHSIFLVFFGHQRRNKNNTKTKRDINKPKISDYSGDYDERTAVYRTSLSCVVTA